MYATKLLNFTEGKFEFAYNWMANGETNWDFLRVALVPASVSLTAGTSLPSGLTYSAVPSGWIAIDGGSQLVGVTDWQSQSVGVNVPAGNYYLVMAWRNDGSGGVQPPAAVDNVSITRVACPYDVSGLSVSNITTSSATLSWEGGEATQWQVAYGTANNFEGATEEIVSTASYNMTSLQSSSTYFVKVRAFCGGEDFGSWSNVLSFATACDAMDLSNVDFSENFDGITLASTYAPSTRTLPICWNYINTSTYVSNAVYPTMYYYSSTDYSYSTPNCLRFYSTYSSSTSYDPQDEYAILPAMDNLAGKQITLWIRGYNATTPFKVGMITNPTDASTFVEITNDANPSLSTSYQEFTYIIPADATANYVAIMMEAAISSNTTRGLYIDDIQIADAPTCAKPTELEVTGVSTTTVTLGWTNGADDQTSWQICLNGDEENLIEANSIPFTVEGLTASTDYTAKVRAHCSADDQSDWSNEVSFTTDCDVIIVDAAKPFTEGFEGDWTPLCWENIPYVSGTTTRRWTRTTISSNIHTGTGAAYSGYYGPVYLVMPDLQLGTDGDAVQLTFWSYNSYVDDYDKNSIVLLDGENEVELWSPTSVYSSWEETTIDLTEYMGQTISIAFKYEGDNAHGWYVDDVRVGAPASTYTLEINAYTGDNDNYYLIASPIGAIAANMVEGLRTPDFDFYSFNQSGTNGDGLEWINLRDDEVYELQPGVGYLYANNSGEDLTFNGTGITEGAYEMDLAYDSNAEDFPGWNLMGNPFCVAATSSMPYYRMQNGAFLPELQEGDIAPMEGFFVCATAENQKVTITPSNGNKGSMLALNLTESGKLVDRTIVSFGKGQQLPKLQLFSKSKVYIEQDNKDYAIVNAEEIGEMPVSFKAEKNGNYTISFSNENVEFGYLHLIDNMTGADIDLLETPSYSFDAKVTDYASRFKLVFATGNSDDNSFAFYNNGNIVISNEGNAILNIVDVLGRTISSQNINGSENVSINAKAGVYMLQLIQGEKVMTQKIVVE